MLECYNWIIGVMGMQASSEANGVTCCVCSLKLPKDEWEFTEFQGFYCFFSRKGQTQPIAYTLSQQTAKTVTVNKGMPVFRFFRPTGQDYRYKCAVCFSKTEPLEVCRAMDLELQGRGLVAIPSEKMAEVRTEKRVTTLQSFHNTRLRGNPSGQVDLTTNNDTWQKWEPVYIDSNRFFWKSNHGTYLRAYPDGRVDLSPNTQDWEIWTKLDYGSYHLWRSFHGTYLRGHPDGKVDLAQAALDWERWVD